MHAHPLPIVAAILLVLGSTASLPAQNTPPRQGLNARLGQIDFQQVPLDDALNYLRDTSGLNLYINWAALELAGVDRNTPVTLRLRGITARQLLDLLLRSAAPGQLSWYVDENVVHVTTRDVADAVMITRVYPVMDLLTEVRDFPAPDVTLESGGEGGDGLFSGNGGDSADDASTLDNEPTPSFN